MQITLRKIVQNMYLKVENVQLQQKIRHYQHK
jgi:hypothetical protein